MASVKRTASEALAEALERAPPSVKRPAAEALMEAVERKRMAVADVRVQNGHPRCIFYQHGECSGDAVDSFLVRHVLNGTLMDVYCWDCFSVFVDRKPHIDFLPCDDE